MSWKDIVKREDPSEYSHQESEGVDWNKIRQLDKKKSTVLQDLEMVLRQSTDDLKSTILEFEGSKWETNPEELFKKIETLLSQVEREIELMHGVN